MGYRRQDRLSRPEKMSYFVFAAVWKELKTLQTETKEKVISAKNYLCCMIKRLFHNRSGWTRLGCFYLAFYYSTRQSRPKRKLFCLSFECNEMSTHTLITLKVPLRQIDSLDGDFGNTPLYKTNKYSSWKRPKCPKLCQNYIPTMYFKSPTKPDRNKSIMN